MRNLFLTILSLVFAAGGVAIAIADETPVAQEEFNYFDAIPWELPR